MKICTLALLTISITAFGQNWNSTSTPTTTSDYTTSIQATHIGWGSHHGILFNAHRSSSLVSGPLYSGGNTKNTFDAGSYGLGAGAIMFLGNGGRMDFFVAQPSTGAGTDVPWGEPKITVTRTGVGIGAVDPFSNFEVRRTSTSTGQTVTVANFTFAGENHFEQPGVYTEGRIVLGSKAYGNGILKRAEIGYSTSGTWRGGQLKFYTTPDDDSWVPLQRMVINQNGDVGIGTNATNLYKLAVNGKIGAREVNVNTDTWGDYVLKDDYKLPPLAEVQEFIRANHHLPEVPSEEEVLQNGQDLGTMNVILLKKIEELTLYMIEQNQKLEDQNNRLVELEKENKGLKKRRASK